MTETTSDSMIHSINIVKTMTIDAPIEIAFEAVLEEMGPQGQMPGGKPFPFTLEPWPGGRWFRDLGDNAGHLWGHVQVIKPPKLLELCGPLFMSYPAQNFLQYRLAAEGDGTRLTFTHRAFGQIPEADRTGVAEGWSHFMDRIREIAATLKGRQRNQVVR